MNSRLLSVLLPLSCIAIWGCSVTAESNLLTLIETEVEGDTLFVNVESSVESHLPMEVAGTVADIGSAEANNGATVVVTGISRGSLALQANNAGHVSASGTVADLTVVANNGGAVH